MQESVVASLCSWKRSLGLPQPGSFESLHREARNVGLTAVAFDGAKADLAKGLSANFQVSHSFALGSSAAPPSYTFGSIYARGKHMLHGMMDTNGVFQGKYHFTATDALTVKMHAQLAKQAGQSMLQTEGDYVGSDWSANVKAINPDVTEAGAGIYTVSLLQSFTKRLAAGVELIAQKASKFDPVESGINVAARYSGDTWVATANVQQLVALQASFFHRVSERVELGTEMQMLLFGPRRDAVASIAAKFDYRQALVRAQLDSTGKVGLLYEERLFPGFSLLLSGELDHARASSRFGFGINLEN